MCTVYPTALCSHPNGTQDRLIYLLEAHCAMALITQWRDTRRAHILKYPAESLEGNVGASHALLSPSHYEVDNQRSPLTQSITLTSTTINMLQSSLT